MRFFADGPSIPNALIAARDEGRVVLLCGAGVSRPAGLPDFFKLAKQVARDLGIEARDDLGKLLAQAKPAPGQYGPGMDEVFAEFYAAYGAAQVKEAVFARLGEVSARPTAHKDLLTVATGPDGRVRLVTTNFDRLFEQAGEGLHLYTPPRLPDLAGSEAFDGVVHLHGAIPGAGAAWHEEAPPIVLSRAEFGAAYLADGWATAFMKALLRTNIAVMVGYSANDPPVRYLLEGLQQGKNNGCQEVYAFAADADEATHNAWRGRGVRAIGYDAANDHRALWATITAWAGQAGDPKTWRQRVVSLAQKGPAALQAFERGQVVALCSTTAGATAFQEASEPPPAEWLCVFDAECRCSPGMAQARRIACFGLDDDSTYDRERGNPPGGVINLLRELPGEPILRQPVDLTGSTLVREGDYSARLFQIARWITKVADSPTAVWWAARNVPLNSFIINSIQVKVRDKDFGTPVLRQAWRLILEVQKNYGMDLDREFSELKAAMSEAAQPAHALWMLERYVLPRVTMAWTGRSDFPPEGEARFLTDFAKFKMFYPSFPIEGDGSNLATDMLEALVRAFEGGLSMGIRLENEIFGCDCATTERDQYQANLDWLRKVLAKRQGMPVDGVETEPMVPQSEVVESALCGPIHEATGAVNSSPIGDDSAQNVGSDLFCRWEGLVKKSASSLSSSQLRGTLKVTSAAVRFDTMKSFRTHMCRLIDGGNAAVEVFRRFIKEAWPRERRYQTAQTSRHIVFVLSQLGDGFSQGVKLAKHCLVPVPYVFWGLLNLGFGPETADGNSPFYQRDPWATFIILYSIFDPAYPPEAYMLGEALTRLSGLEPGLLRDRRYQEMVTFVRQHGGS